MEKNIIRLFQQKQQANQDNKIIFASTGN